MTELKFKIAYIGEVPYIGTTDFFGQHLSVQVDERRPLLHYKQKLIAKAFRCYLIGHLKRRITAFEKINHNDKKTLNEMKLALNSLQYEVQKTYADFRKQIRLYENLLKVTLPKKEDKSHHVITYIYSHLWSVKEQ